MPKDEVSKWLDMQHSFRANLQQKTTELSQCWQLYLANDDLTARQELKRLCRQLAGAAEIYSFKGVRDSAGQLAALLAKPFSDELTQRIQEHNCMEVLEQQLSSTTQSKHRNQTEHLLEAQDNDLPGVLLFDQDEQAAECLAGELRAHGFNLVIESDAANLYDTLLRTKPQVVLCSIQLHHQHCLSLEAICSSKHQLGYQPEVLCFSEYDTFEARLAAARAGCQHLMLKPVDPKQVLHQLNKLIHKEKAEPYQILLVDPDADVLRFYRHALSMGGYTVATATEAKAAYELAIKIKPELMLIDLNLKGCSGIELGKIVRQHQGLANTPLIFMAQQQEGNERMAEADLAGDDFIQKPIAPWRLLMTVEAKVKRSRLLKQEQRAVIQRPELIQHIDTLTALPTLWQLKRELKKNSDREGTLCLMKLDLDQFHLINDVYGRETGDLVLQTIAWQLAQLLSEQDHLYRESGDEFWLLCRQLTTLEQAAEFTEHMLLVLEQISTNFDVSIHFTASVGICLVSEQQAPDVLLQHASTALYEAKKKAGHQFRFYDPQQQQKIDLRQQLSQTIRQAISKKQFSCVFQPIFSADNKLTSLELLARWRHPEQGNISPALFIPLLEEQGLISYLTRQMLDLGLPQLQLWRQQWPELSLNINVSAQDLADPELCEQLLARMQHHELPNHALVIEITESILIQAGSGSFEQLQQLVAHGFAIALDDFGTGYSSLSYLDKLPVSRLKIDRSFVQRIDENKHDKLLPAIIHLANDLELEITAEGVETKAQFDYLKTVGCQRFQGYFFSKPLTADDIAKTAWFQQALID
ncbi:EAL domain-containing protein [Alkalimonas amylolytica]|uniref:Diguanylate cyclase (GGDEF) domain-containing protein n=1 Tax=Alkalimonas amylolytica TaxID=152573 RepID=A0A1H3ZHG6_ALKAM|nr:EAL domain-containing protein [Alkalimonas amylolytica]SEA23097.1 diguanylate cyclase (GGDEF) domain-containing protein [Alkalimonas amylolytica]